MSALARAARVALAGAAVGGSLLAGRRLRRAYREDMREAYAAVEDAGSAVLETAAGDVEFVTRGEGIPVLVAHGIVGGFDQALQTGQSLFDAETACIGVSRFGYLGSELPVDSTPEAQARAYRDVLDHLGVDETVVVGTSAGGAPAIRFALDYPDRTRALVLIGSTAPREREITGATGPPHAILRDSVFWLLVTYAPWAFLKLFGVDGDDYAAAAPEEQRRVEALLETLLPVEPRKQGIYNDERVTNTAMVERDDEYDLESLRVPTLILHAEDDPLASFADVERMAVRIPDATFRPYRTGGHLVFGHGDEVRRTVTDFVESA
ncbi:MULTISPECIES: alpha/beta fold hydrolase [Salinibaculum]|uniref:alpha/beta fold hydrolase n=1 Tax=Salinibaculum TaxID=2732368 RepID=UPI0030CAAD9F